MPRLLILLLAALGGAAIWRRREIRNDAERASNAIAGAARSAKPRIRPTDDGEDDDGNVGVEASPLPADEVAAEEMSSG